jgi:hypothetical protein
MSDGTKHSSSPSPFRTTKDDTMHSSYESPFLDTNAGTIKHSSTASPFTPQGRHHQLT